MSVSICCGYIQRKRCVVDDCVLFAALLPGAELWNDSFLSLDDLEGSDGCHWQRESHCSCSQVSLSRSNVKINNLSVVAVVHSIFVYVTNIVGRKYHCEV